MTLHSMISAMSPACDSSALDLPMLWSVFDLELGDTDLTTILGVEAPEGGVLGPDAANDPYGGEFDSGVDSEPDFDASTGRTAVHTPFFLNSPVA